MSCFLSQIIQAGGTKKVLAGWPGFISAEKTCVQTWDSHKINNERKVGYGHMKLGIKQETHPAFTVP